MDTRIITDWFQANDAVNDDVKERVFGRMVEILKGETWFPAIEHKITGANPNSRDISFTWASPLKLSTKDFEEVTKRFQRVFEAYDQEVGKREAALIREAADRQAIIDAEVSKKLAAKKEEK